LRENLIKLALVLDSKMLKKESWAVYRLIKSARTREFIKTVFLTLYPQEVRGKVISVSQSYYRAFKDSDPERLTEEALVSFLESNTLEDVILVLKDHKTKEREAIQETSVKRFLGSEGIISDELKKALQDEHEAALLRLEESDVSKKNYEWAVKILLNEEEDPMEEIIGAIGVWRSAKHNLEDLYKYEKLSDLRKALDSLGVDSKPAYYYSIKNHALSERNTDFIYNSDNFSVVLCGTTQSSQYWARGTVWCTASLVGNYFENYSSKGIYLYYLIAKNDEVFENYTPEGWGPGLPGFGLSFEEKKNTFKKISIGYSKNGNDLILLDRQNATVDSNNHDISKSEILQFLGDEGSTVFSAIENDLRGRESTKFDEVRSSITPEELERTLGLLNGDEKYDLVESFANSGSAKQETIEYSLNLLSENLVTQTHEGPYGFFLDSWSSKGAQKHSPELWSKYQKKVLKGLVSSKKTAGIFFSTKLYLDFPELIEKAFSNLVIAPGRGPVRPLYDISDDDYYDLVRDEDQGGLRWFSWGLGDLSHLIDLQQEFLENERTRGSIKNIFDNAIKMKDPNLLEVKKRILDDLYREDKDFDNTILRPLIEEICTSKSPTIALKFFGTTFGWHKHFPDLKDSVIDYIISIEPGLLGEGWKTPIGSLQEGFNNPIKMYPDLLPIAVWGMTIREIYDYRIHEKYPKIVSKLFHQINDGGRRAIHPKLFTKGHKDHMRGSDIRDLAESDLEVLFRDILKKDRIHADFEEDEADVKELGMDINHLLGNSSFVSPMIEAEIEDMNKPIRQWDRAKEQADLLGMDVEAPARRHHLQGILDQLYPDQPEEDLDPKVENAKTTWEEHFPVLNNLRNSRKADLFSIMRTSRGIA
jgi:hypothetical protein